MSSFSQKKKKKKKIIHKKIKFADLKYLIFQNEKERKAMSFYATLKTVFNFLLVFVLYKI